MRAAVRFVRSSTRAATIEAFPISNAERSRCRAPNPLAISAASRSTSASLKGQHPVGDSTHPRALLVCLLAGQEQPGDHPRRIGLEMGRRAVRESLVHRCSTTRRACCAVDSMANVDSAP